VHVYSLVHDDPAGHGQIDDLRRGRPTCHKAYDEGHGAAGGRRACSRWHFKLLASDPEGWPGSPAIRLRLIEDAGASQRHAGEWPGGQAIDLAVQGRAGSTSARSKTCMARKTGAVIRAQRTDGGRSVQPPLGSESSMARLFAIFANAVGPRPFQNTGLILLDVTGDASMLGKATGRRQAGGAPSRRIRRSSASPASQQRVRLLHNQAIHSTRAVRRNEPKALRSLAPLALVAAVLISPIPLARSPRRRFTDLGSQLRPPAQGRWRRHGSSS